MISSPSVLVTGALGFTGPHLIKRLEASGFSSRLISREFAGLGHTPAINIAEPASVESFINQWKPDYVIHLAAISNPSHPDRDEIKKINVGGTRNLLAAIEKASAK